MLRQHYLTADMGISGGNFFVAETGSVVVVTNEGNATLTTTLPKVHVAISGIEKIVPTLEDVATLMRLLPRSATGQSISNYVDILTGPKGAGEFNGAEHMYFILVDSGRTAVLASDVREALRCIRCGACMNHCPVYQNVGGHSYGWVYPGPIGSILTPMYVGLEKAQDLPAASTLCNQCGVVCPVKIPLPDLQRKLREQAFETGLRPWYERTAPRAVVVDGAAARALCASRPSSARGCCKAWGGRDGMIHKLPLASGWTDGRDMPAPAGQDLSRALSRETSGDARMNAPHEHASVDTAAVATRRVARHRERLRRAGRGQCARPPGQGHRLVLHRTARLPDARERAGRRHRGHSRRASTGIRPPPASTSCARRRRRISARGAASRSSPRMSSWARAPSPSSPTPSHRSPTTAPATKSIYPVPGFPIYESQVVANGAVPVPIYLRESRDFAFDPAELEAKITPKTRLLILNTPHNPTGGMLQAEDLDAIAEILQAASAGVGVRGRDLFAARVRGRVRVARAAAGDARAHDHLRRRVEDVGDDRLADRLRREPHAGAGVHALDHQHRLVRVADLAVGGGRGDDRTAGRGRGDARELPRAPRPHRRAAEPGARHPLQGAGRSVLCVAERHRGVLDHGLRRLRGVPQAAADRGGRRRARRHPLRSPRARRRPAHPLFVRGVARRRSETASRGSTRSCAGTWATEKSGAVRKARTTSA